MSQATANRRHVRPSARLGLTLRSILLSPRAGFEAAISATERRRTGSRARQGVTTAVPAFAGGAAAILLWLKIGALAGVRDTRITEFEWSLLLAALAVGGLLGVATQFAWSYLATPVVRRLGGSVAPEELRLVWGAAAFPLVFGLVLLPLDAVIVGGAAFTSSGPGETVPTAWAALSVALGVCFAIWWLFLLVRGTEIAGRTSPARGALAVAVGGVLVGALVLMTKALLNAAPGGS